MNIAALVENPLAFNIMILIASFVILAAAADKLVYGISRYAKRMGLSDFIVGLLIISVVASAPEFISSIMGLAAGDSGIIFGTFLGSNLIELTLVMGIFALVGRKINLKNPLMEKTEVVLFFVILLPFILVADGSLARTDGIMLLMTYAGYIAFLWRRESKKGKIREQVKVEFIWKDALIFLIALAALLLSARWLVHSSINISNMLNIPSFLVALIVLGIGGSLPDITVGIRALLQGHQDVGLGNFLGSVTAISLLFFGIIALIKPLVIDLNLIFPTMVFTILALGFVLYLSQQKKMDWKHGIYLILLYIVFIVIELTRYK